jgi:predicted phosphodiesterase
MKIAALYDIHGNLPALNALLEELKEVQPDLIVMAFAGQPLSPALPEEVREVTQWIAGQLTRSQRDFLAALPQQLVLQVEGLGRVLFCHATVRSDEEIFTSITPQERLTVIFSHVEQQTCIGYLGYPFLKMRVNDDSPSSFPLLLQDQMGGDKVSCLAVSLLVLV